MSAQLKIAGPTDVVAKSHIQVQENFRAAMKQTEEFMAFGHGNFDAAVKCSEIWTRGVQELAKQMAASAQSTLDEALATFKAFSSIKSPQEALDLQTKLASSAWEKTLAESGRISDASVKLFQEALAPLTARATTAAEKLSKTA